MARDANYNTANSYGVSEPDVPVLCPICVKLIDHIAGKAEGKCDEALCSTVAELGEEAPLICEALEWAASLFDLSLCQYVTRSRGLTGSEICKRLEVCDDSDLSTCPSQTCTACVGHDELSCSSCATWPWRCDRVPLKMCDTLNYKYPKACVPSLECLGMGTTDDPWEEKDRVCPRSIDFKELQAPRTVWVQGQSCDVPLNDCEGNIVNGWWHHIEHEIFNINADGCGRKPLKETTQLIATSHSDFGRTCDLLHQRPYVFRFVWSCRSRLELAA